MLLLQLKDFAIMECEGNLGHIRWHCAMFFQDGFVRRQRPLVGLILESMQHQINSISFFFASAVQM